jgi:uncharacterized protein YndB with AHSA1/START domain
VPDPITASIEIAAEPDRVFDFFTRPELMVRWMGDFARLDPHPGGDFHVDIRGVPVRGTYLEVERPTRLLVSWGHAGSERIPPGATTVEIRLRPTVTGTCVEIVHGGLPEPEARGHVRGWRLFLDRLAIAAAGGDPGRDAA